MTYNRTGMDPELVKRAQHGDERAFEALTIATHPRLFRVAFGILRDAEIAEDATQQAFIDSWRFLRRLGERAHFEAWTCHWLIEACQDKAEPPTDHEDGDSSGPGFMPSAPDPFGVVVDRDDLARGFRQLSFEDRAVLVLRYLAGYESADRAIALDLSVDEQEARLDSALAALETALDGPAEPGPELVAQGEPA